MTRSKRDTVEALLLREEWEKARKRLQKELAGDPDNHWLLTQLGVTFYEQGQFLDALKCLRSSLEIVPDCPLTLWNLAGTLDSLGKTRVAIPIDTWLLNSKRSPVDDSCWESEAWTDSLKTDCVYRLGVCFQHLGSQASAEHCFRQYLNLMLAGMVGSYPMEDVAIHFREPTTRGKKQLESKVRATIDSALLDSGIPRLSNGRHKLPKLKFDELLQSTTA